MNRNNTKKGIMDCKKYLFVNTGLTILLMITFITVGINKFVVINKTFSLVFFVTEYILLVYCGMRVGIKYKRRNLFHVFLNVLSPLGAYLFVWHWIEISKKYLINIIIIFAVSAFLDLVWVEDGSLKKRWKCFKEYVGTELRPMVCVMFIFVGAMAIWAQANGQDAARTSEQMYQEWNDYRPEDSLAANIEQASTIEQWSELNNKEKEQLLNLYLKIESRYWGMKDLPQLEISDLEENTLGRYSSSADVIYIDNELMESNDGYEVIFVLLHEMYHRHEHIIVELYNKILQDENYSYYTENSIWYDANEYAREFASYVTADESIEGYVDQKVEKDADYWASQGVLEIQEKIQEYLQEKE